MSESIGTVRARLSRTQMKLDGANRRIKELEAVLLKDAHWHASVSTAPGDAHARDARRKYKLLGINKTLNRMRTEVNE